MFQKLFYSRYLLLILLVVLAVLHWPLSHLPLGRDQGVWNSVGFALFQGDVFYRDLLHFNLPGLGFSFAALFHISDSPIANVAMLNYVASALIVSSSFYLFSHTLSRNVAVMASALFVLFSSTGMDYWNIAQKDFLAMAFIMPATALLHAADASKKSHYLLVFLSGFAVAVAVLYKPLFGIAGVFLAASEVLRFRLLPKFLWWHCFYRLSILLLGFLTLLAIFIGYIEQYNMLSEAQFALFEFAFWYSNNQSVGFAKLLGFLLLWSTMPDIAQLWLSLVQMLLWLPIMFYGMYCLIKHYSWRQYYFLVTPLLTAIFCYLIQKKGFPYHAMPWIVMSILFIGIGVVHLLCLDKKWYFLAYGFLVFILVKQLVLGAYIQQLVPTTFGVVERDSYLKHNYSPPDSPHPVDSEKAATWIQNNVAKDKTIAVWGMENQIYALSQRRFFARHHFSFFLDAKINGEAKLEQWQQTLRQEYLEQLETEPPAVFVFTFIDKGGDRALASQSIVNVPDLYEFINQRYEKAVTFGRLDIYRLR